MNETMEILPCPFCKGAAHLVERIPDGDDDTYYDVSCDDPNCYLSEGADWYFDTEKEAVESWNKRK